MTEYYIDVVILGSGIAGRTAAETARRCRPEISILMISHEQSCLRPLLSKAGIQSVGGESVLMEAEQWLSQFHIQKWDTAITSISPENHIVYTEEGAVRYGKCIYALGSQPFIPPFPGHNLKGVFSLRTSEDITAIKRSLLQVHRAVIIGGGVIGIEMGEMLVRYGIGVTILETQPWLMPRILDRETAEEYCNCLEACRVETGITVKCMNGIDSVTGVELADGRVFPCELVIVSCGVRPNTAIAAEAGLEIKRAIPVSSRMETEAADLYACGDCVQYEGQCPALWKVAIDQGRVAAQNACGMDAIYRADPHPVVFYSPQASLFAMGDLAVSGTDGYRIEIRRWTANRPFLVTPRATKGYSRLVYKNGRLVGAALIGDLSDMFSLQHQIAGEVK